MLVPTVPAMTSARASLSYERRRLRGEPTTLARDETQSSAPPPNSRLLSADGHVCPHTTYARKNEWFEERPVVRGVYGYEDTPAGGAQHLYRYECLRLRGLDLLPVAYGRTNDDARENLYEDLKRKGVMPPTEIE
jgi:hypothetical protein